MEAGDELGPLLKEEKTVGHPVVRVLYLLGGVICMVLGVVGWLIPIVTGIPFYIAGLWLFGMSSQRARHWINHNETKLPERLRRALRGKFRKKRASSA